MSEPDYDKMLNDETIVNKPAPESPGVRTMPMTKAEKEDKEKLGLDFGANDASSKGSELRFIKTDEQQVTKAEDPQEVQRRIDRRKN